MFHRLPTIVTCVAVLFMAVVTLHADLKKSLADADGRRKAAESGVLQIRAQGGQAVDAQAAYSACVEANNAWWEATAAAAESGSAPDLAGLAGTAAETLVTWVNQRNAALSLPVLTGPTASAVAKTVTNDLTEISRAVWAQTRKEARDRRARTINAIGQRLRWVSWADVR